MKTYPERRCKYCQKLFKPRRPDQEFCAKGCRNVYYYHQDKPASRTYNVERTLEMDSLREAAKAVSSQKKLWQAENTKLIEDYVIRPTVSPNCKGFELIPPPRSDRANNPTWYLATFDEAISAIPRHRLHYHRLVLELG